MTHAVVTMTGKNSASATNPKTVPEFYSHDQKMNTENWGGGGGQGKLTFPQKFSFTPFPPRIPGFLVISLKGFFWWWKKGLNPRLSPPASIFLNFLQEATSFPLFDNYELKRVGLSPLPVGASADRLLERLHPGLEFSLLRLPQRSESGKTAHVLHPQSGTKIYRHCIPFIPFKDLEWPRMALFYDRLGVDPIV